MSKKIKALKDMVRQGANMNESRNALKKLLDLGENDPDLVMEFCDNFHKHKEEQAPPPPVRLPDEISFAVQVDYNMLISSIKGGYSYMPMVQTLDHMTPLMYTDYETFIVTIPLSIPEKSKSITVLKNEKNI